MWCGWSLNQAQATAVLIGSSRICKVRTTISFTQTRPDFTVWQMISFRSSESAKHRAVPVTQRNMSMVAMLWERVSWLEMKASHSDPNNRPKPHGKMMVEATTDL